MAQVLAVGEASVARGGPSLVRQSPSSDFVAATHHMNQEDLAGTDSDSTELTISPEIFTSETEQDNGDGENCVSPTKPILFNDKESGTAPVYSQHDDDERLHTSQVNLHIGACWGVCPPSLGKPSSSYGV